MPLLFLRSSSLVLLIFVDLRHRSSAFHARAQNSFIGLSCKHPVHPQDMCLYFVLSKSALLAGLVYQNPSWYHHIAFRCSDHLCLFAKKKLNMIFGNSTMDIVHQHHDQAWSGSKQYPPRHFGGFERGTTPRDRMTYEGDTRGAFGGMLRQDSLRSYSKAWPNAPCRC